MDNIINRLLRKSKSLDLLRHCFATHLFEADTNILHIKKLLGHAHIQTTSFYISLAAFDANLKSPLDSITTQPKKKRGRKPKQKLEVLFHA